MTSIIPNKRETRSLPRARGRSTDPIPTLDAVLRRLAASPGRPVGLAVSGGVDSTALLEAAARLAPSAALLVLTVDHASDDGRSARQARFVQGLAARFGVRALVLRADPSAVAPRGRPSEARWRAERLRLLDEASLRYGLAAVLLAHHREDVAEGFVLAALRRAGLRGLAGPPRRRLLPGGSLLVRPWLRVPRARLVRAVRAAGLEWSEDPTNLDLRFLRNRVRHLFLPALRRRFGPDLDARLARAARLARVAERRAPSASDRLHREIERTAGRFVRGRTSLQIQEALREGRRAVFTVAPGVRLACGPSGIERMEDPSPPAPAWVEVRAVRDPSALYEHLRRLPPETRRERFDRRGLALLDADRLLGPLRSGRVAPDLAFRPVGRPRARPVGSWARSAGWPAPRRRELLGLFDGEGLVALEGIGPAARAALTAHTRRALRVRFRRRLRPAEDRS